MVGGGNADLGITTDEYRLIFQLKLNVKDVLTDRILSKSKDDQDLFFVRWIRARENDLDKATDMLRNHLKWRIENKVDDAINFKIHPFFQQNYPITYEGVDKMGQPIIGWPFNQWDFRKVVNDAERLAEFQSFVTNLFETAMQAVEIEHAKRPSDHPPITQLTFLVDAHNFPKGQLINYGAIKKIAQFATIYEAHYPECCSRVIIINCPSYFGLVLNILKPVVAAKTMAKFRLFPSMAKWQDEMTEIVDPACLPARYGGLLK